MRFRGVIPGKRRFARSHNRDLERPSYLPLGFGSPDRTCTRWQIADKLIRMTVSPLPIQFGTGGYISFVCAELFMLLTRAREIILLLKRDGQRSPVERKEVARGLCRAVLLEGFVFLPASVLLVLIVVRPLVLLLPFGFFYQEPTSQAIYGLLGILSYQFPFSVVRRVITRAALKTLQSFANIALKEDSLPVPPQEGGV